MDTVQYTELRVITIDTLEYKSLLRQKIEYDILVKTILQNSRVDKDGLTLNYTCDSAVDKLLNLFKKDEFESWKEEKKKEKEE